MTQGQVEWEDLDIYFDEFAVDATLTLADGTAFDLKGIYETPYMKRDFGEMVVDADDPSFTCKWHDGFEKARRGDKLTLSESGEVFYIESGARNDGTGVASFILTAAETQDSEGDDVPPSGEDGVQQNPQNPQSPQGQGGRPDGGLFGSGR